MPPGHERAGRKTLSIYIYAAHWNVNINYDNFGKLNVVEARRNEYIHYLSLWQHCVGTRKSVSIIEIGVELPRYSAFAVAAPALE